MTYEINVSKNGKHLFATHERSLTRLNEAHALALLFREKFPPEDGYEIRLTEQRRSQRVIEL